MTTELQKFALDADENQMWITGAGVHEVERINLEIDRRTYIKSEDGSK